MVNHWCGGEARDGISLGWRTAYVQQGFGVVVGGGGGTVSLVWVTVGVMGRPVGGGGLGEAGCRWVPSGNGG